MNKQRATWSKPTAHSYGAFSTMTQQLVTVCAFKEIGTSDGVNLVPSQRNQDSVCSI